MSWKIQVYLLVLFLIPSFIGYPFSLINSHIIFSWSNQYSHLGPTDGQLLYFVVAMLSIIVICGLRKMLLGLTAGALVSISIVFFGGFIAFIRTKIGIPNSPVQYQFSPYYITRYVNIITVVPLALSIFTTIPFLDFERSIIGSSQHVSLKQKIFLMIVRVINNVSYAVLPGIWSVIAEEKCDKVSLYINDIKFAYQTNLLERIKKIFIRNLYVAVIGIAASLEYVPLWAVEIAQLPTRKKGGI